MTHFQIINGRSAGVVALGDSRDQLRARLGKHRAFRRTPASKESDQFIDCGLMATYSPDDRVVMLEFASPGQVSLRGIRLLGQDIQSLAAQLMAENLALVTDDCGAVVSPLGVVLYAPAGTVEGVQLGSD